MMQDIKEDTNDNNSLFSDYVKSNKPSITTIQRQLPACSWLL